MDTNQSLLYAQINHIDIKGLWGMAVLTRRACQREVELNYVMAIQFDPGDTGEAAYLKAMAQVSAGLS